jgi:hypothetical protein
MNTLEFCEKYLENYIINPDNTIDVNGNVFLRLGNMEKLPVKFGKVSGWFNCGWNNLTTLEGFPKYVGSHISVNFLSHHILGNVQGNIYIHTSLSKFQKRIVI